MALFPISSNSNGRVFQNPPSYRLSPAEQPAQGHPSLDPNFHTIFTWQTSLRPRWPDDLPLVTPDPLPDLDAGEISVSFINHASFLLRFGRKDARPFTVITDPIFSSRCSPSRHFGPRRVLPPGLDLAKIPPIDLVLISHCHYDHLDRPSLRRIGRRDRPACIAPLGNRRHLRGLSLGPIMTLDWWQTRVMGDLLVTATPALHGSARTPFDADRALWSGFHLQYEGTSVLFAGDTAHGHHWEDIRRRLGAPDLALMPIGAYEPVSLMRNVHMTPEQAAEAAVTLEAGRALAMHYGTFQLTDEGYWEPPARLSRHVRILGRAPEWFTTLRQGGCLRLGT